MDEARSQEEINKYKKFRKVDGATYRKVNQFLRKRTYITAREWALARLCTDFRTTGGAEMTFIGQHLPELVPFMEDTYSPQAVNQARNSFKKKVRKSSATFFYGAMCGFFTTEELDDLLFEASEVARFLLEVESTTLDIDEEIDIEDRITGVMRSVGEAAKTVLKTRGIEGGEGTAPVEGEGAVAPLTTLSPPPSRPGAVRRGRKRRIREEGAAGPAPGTAASPAGTDPLTPSPVTPGMMDPVEESKGEVPSFREDEPSPAGPDTAVEHPGTATPYPSLPPDPAEEREAPQETGDSGNPPDQEARHP